MEMRGGWLGGMILVMVQANLSNQATCQTEENGWIRHVVGIERLEKYMEKFNRLGFLAGLDRKSE